MPFAETGSANTELDVHEPGIRGSHTLLANHWVGEPMITGVADQVGPECVGHAVERADAGDDVERVAALGLRDDRDLPAFGEARCP